MFESECESALTVTRQCWLQSMHERVTGFLELLYEVGLKDF